jgi:VanZ family protein
MKFTILASTLIIIAVLLPGSTIPEVGFGGVDKLVHFVMFFSWAIACRLDRKSHFNAWIAAVLGIAFSLLTEVLQIMVEGRTFDAYDITADVVGLVAGLLLSKPIVSALSRFLH